MKKIKDFLLNILFPKFCFSCGKEGIYLCEDCKSILEICQYRYCLCKNPKRLTQGGRCFKCRSKQLTGLYFAMEYKNPLIKELIQKFKYHPFIKELAKPLASLIITHFQLLEDRLSLSNSVLIPIPLDKKRLRWRGFNQATEISKELSKNLNVPLVSNCLAKIKEVQPQTKLTAEERKENVKGIFKCKKPEVIYGKNILLVDDIYTTGSTMEEAARVLKKSGARKILGVVVARE